MAIPREEKIKVYPIEKVLINFALPSDFIYHSLKSKLSKGEYQYAHQTLSERMMGIYNGKVEKYQKLLIIKENNEGQLPERVRKVCKETLCGKVRLGLSDLR